MTHTGESAEATGAHCAIDKPCSCNLPMVVGIVLGLVLLDQITKEIAIALLEPQNVVKVYFNDWFRFQFATNTGAFLSLGSTLPESVRFWVLTGLNGVILLGVACFLVFKPGMSRSVSFALSLILAGGIGNIIDRLFRGGEVVDFMNMGFPDAQLWGHPLRTGIFNVADVAIMLGLGMLVLIELFSRKDPKEQGEDE